MSQATAYDHLRPVLLFEDTGHWLDRDDKE
jgi:hypothetical protein